MFNRTTLATFAVFVVLTAIVAPPVDRTIHLASSADGLLLLASLSDDDFSLNPWSEDCYLVRQATAAAILKDYGWPYRRRISILRNIKPPPLIYQAVSARGSVGTSDNHSFSTESDHRLLELISVFINRELPIDESWEGYTPLQLAILHGDEEVVELLIANDADLHAAINNPGRAHNGMNSLEFADFLLEKQPQDYARIHEVLSSAYDESSKQN